MHSLNHPLKKLLKVPLVNHKLAGERSFYFAALAVWNSLPSSLCNIPNFLQLKSHVKMHLLHQAFPQFIEFVCVGGYVGGVCVCAVSSSEDFWAFILFLL